MKIGGITDMHGEFFASRRLSLIVAFLGVCLSLGGCATMGSMAQYRSSIDNQVWASPTTGRMVAWNGHERPGTIVISTSQRTLALVQKGGSAIEYDVGVGRPGFTWTGYKQVSEKRIWPGWTPPPQMHQRQRGLPSHMVGGVENPLGARALILGSSLYRIHGSNDPETIGQAVSSGCFRMNNGDVMDLFERVRVGTPVIVRS
jgi:lipoprotein-anchoring transpeptidase ErfK/SrfK